MANYHINGKGEPGLCRATKSCPFGDMDKDHYSTPEEARRGYEKNFEKFQVLKKDQGSSPSATIDHAPEPKEKVLSYDKPVHRSLHAPGSRAYFDGLRRDPAVAAKVRARFDEIAAEEKDRYEKLSQTEEGKAQLAEEARKSRSRLARDHEASHFHGANSASYYIGKNGRVNRSKQPPAARDRTFATNWHAKAHRDVWRQELTNNGMSRAESAEALYNWTTSNLK